MELSTGSRPGRGRNSPRSSSDPEDRHQDHGDGDGRIEAEPLADEVVDDERPQHVDLAVGELEDAHDAQDQREAQGHQHVEPAEGDPVDDCLQPEIE